MSRIPPSQSRRRPAQIDQLDRGTKARKTLPAGSAPVATLSMGSSSGNAQDSEQAVTFPSMHTRAMGKVLVDANQLLTAGQRRIVIAMEFGAMLNFQITDTPLRLGYWLLSNLDLQSMSLKMPNGQAIEVDEEAVEAVLGLPRGPKVITDRAKHEKSVILNSWRESFEKADYSITPSEVALKLQKYPDGGECFIRNYAILVVSTVVRVMQNGYVYQHVLPNLDDTLEITNLNWCRYVIHSLISTQPAWKAGETQRFTGPLVFLTILYVDRVRAGVCTVPRTLPSFVGWESELLKQREQMEIMSGGFGRGPILELMRPIKKESIFSVFSDHALHRAQLHFLRLLRPCSISGGRLFPAISPLLSPLISQIFSNLTSRVPWDSPLMTSTLTPLNDSRPHVDADLSLRGFWLQKWLRSDKVEQFHGMIDYLLGLVRDGKLTYEVLCKFFAQGAV